MSDVSLYIDKACYDALSKEHPLLIKAISEMLRSDYSPSRVIHCVNNCHPNLLITIVHGATYYIWETGRY